MLLPIIITAGSIALVYLSIFLVHGARESTKQTGGTDEYVVGWEWIETRGPDGRMTVRTPGLERLLALRHANVEETDPQLERWVHTELDAMGEAIREAMEDDAW